MENGILKAYGAARIGRFEPEYRTRKEKNRGKKSVDDVRGKMMQYSEDEARNNNARGHSHDVNLGMMKGKDAGTRQEIRNLVAWQQKVKNNRKKLNRKTRVENRMGGKLGNTAKKPRFDPKVLSEIEGDILDEGAYEPNDTVSGAQRAVRKAANARIRQKLPDVENFVFDKGHTMKRNLELKR